MFKQIVLRVILAAGITSAITCENSGNAITGYDGAEACDNSRCGECLNAGAIYCTDSAGANFTSTKSFNEKCYALSDSSNWNNSAQVTSDLGASDSSTVFCSGHSSNESYFSDATNPKAQEIKGAKAGMCPQNLDTDSCGANQHIYLNYSDIDSA